MNFRSHPSFAGWFKRFFLRAWILAVVFFGVGLLLLKNGFPVLGWTCAICFGLSVFGALGHLLYRLFHVECPSCGGRTRTTKDPSQTFWIARCEACGTVWDLGVGVGDDSS